MNIEEKTDGKTEKSLQQHIEWREDYRENARKIEAYATAAMKAPALVAAGGLAASLAFYSANYTRLKVNPENLDSFNSVLAWLFLGLLFNVAAPGLAYFSQHAYAEYHRISKPPLNGRKPRRKLYFRVGLICQWAAVFLTVGSITSVSIGGLVFLRLVERL